MIWRNTKSQWGLCVIISHWLSFLIIVGLFILGLWMVELNYYHSWYHKAPHLHKSIGLLLFSLILFRVFWRMFNSGPVPVKTHTILERQLAKWVHRLLYGLSLAVMMSGYLISTADGQGVQLFDWFEIPAYISGFDKQADIAGDVHFWLATGFIFVIFIHASAAIKHHLLDKDCTLKRILGKI